jgi:hypothetical protein
MEFEMFNPVDENAYKAVMMLIQGVMMVLGLASLLFLLTWLVCAACSCIQEMARPVRRRKRSVPILEA